MIEFVLKIAQILIHFLQKKIKNLFVLIHVLKITHLIKMIQ